MLSIQRWKTVLLSVGVLSIFSVTYRYMTMPIPVANRPHIPVSLKTRTDKKNLTEASRTNIPPHPQVKEPLLLAFTKECDHFVDWPSPSDKEDCPIAYSLRDRSLSIVLYLRADLDSFPTQTFLSLTQFTRDAHLTITNIVITYIDDPLLEESHTQQVTAMRKLVNHLPVSVTSSDGEWKAKLEGVKQANSEQVFLVDDTIIVNRGFIQPLLYLLERHPKSLIVPHVDSMLPARIYVPYDDKELHPDSVIWQETSLGTYSVSPAMKMARVEHKEINKLPTEMRSRGLNGESFAGRRAQLLSILSKMKTDEPAELSLLSHICGEGVYVTKCSAVVRSNNYYITAPETRDPEELQRLYPLGDTNPNRDLLPGCTPVSHYFNFDEHSES